ncbi:hypothetical protein J2S43_005980 [Catenuloplanes nepalensis]|uniref:Uncharacterized protein n=1 Tax=Catenuloplanes nepalensis TaxID=587533 RepID=A0ABT9N188_9ACTN|nr:hypothetical protein [Catenuloplanes nepalensis]MDP9797468.1 hypothetical protein [Catenuloplanes nepalensis]
MAFSQQPRYGRAASEFLDRYGNGIEEFDEQRLMLLWDCFILEHKLSNGRTVVEQFVAAHPQLPESEREMLLGWQDVVQGPFQVIRREGPALIVESLVDELTYRVRSNMGPDIFRRMPRKSFLIARLVAVGDEWMLSGPVNLLRTAERDIAYRLAMDMALRTPEAVFRNPEKLDLAWKQQRADRDRFIRFFGSDLVVVPGEQAQARLNAFYAFSREELLGGPEPDGPPAGVVVTLPEEMVESETVALIYDETDGIGFYTEFGLVEQAFANPGLLRRRRWREHTLEYLHDDSVEPMVIRRLAERNPDKATTVIRKLLKRPKFDWNRDGETLLREVKPGYYARPPRPRVSPVSERLAAFVVQK